MKIPKKLKIGAHTYTVRELEGWQDGEAVGIEDPNKNQITLDSQLSNTRKEAKLFHEIFHVMNYGLDHALLDSLAEQLYQVLSDNKLLK
jgi:hypothetical protein